MDLNKLMQIPKHIKEYKQRQRQFGKKFWDKEMGEIKCNSCGDTHTYKGSAWLDFVSGKEQKRVYCKSCHREIK